MLERLLIELEKSQKELNNSFNELQIKKEQTISSINERHKELHEAIDSLNETMSNKVTPLTFSNYNSEYSDIDKRIDETSMELDELLASLS